MSFKSIDDCIKIVSNLPDAQCSSYSTEIKQLTSYFDIPQNPNDSLIQQCFVVKQFLENRKRSAREAFESIPTTYVVAPDEPDIYFNMPALEKVRPSKRLKRTVVVPAPLPLPFAVPAPSPVAVAVPAVAVQYPKIEPLVSLRSTLAAAYPKKKKSKPKPKLSATAKAAVAVPVPVPVKRSSVAQFEDTTIADDHIPGNVDPYIVVRNNEMCIGAAGATHSTYYDNDSQKIKEYFANKKL